MAKRHLGLGKSAKAKKQKTDVESVEPATPSNEITVELNQEADANDELAQLKALWKTYLGSKKENELVVNGIIHECDRLLRNSKIGGIADGVDLDASFYSIYALGLAELANFNAAEHDKVVEFFDAALERAESGLQHFPESAELLFTKSKVLIDRIPLQYISQVSVDTEIDEQFPEVSTLLDNALKVYESAEAKADTLGKHDLFDHENLEILETLDDLLDIIDNFGKSEEDDEEESDDEEAVELTKDHPLYVIQNSDKYNQWWRDHTVKYLESVDKHLAKLGEAEEAKSELADLASLRRKICQRIGQSYLQEAEFPSSVFTSLSYDEEFQDAKDLGGLTKKDAQKISQKLISTALKHLRWARDDEEPETWVHIAEAIISLGNLYELESVEQTDLYKEAEEILTTANNATNGKYKDILDNLLQEEE